MDHSELIMEMPRVEQLGTQERLMLARRQRQIQLKVWNQKDKEYSRKPPKQVKSNKRSIVFNDSVVLIESAARNDINEVSRLLEKGVNADSCNEDGLTALHQCCIDNNEAMLELLLEYGANINAEDSEKWTPLHAAATCGHLGLVRVLISKGANLLAVNADGNMPYDICEDETALDFIESEMAKRGVTQRLIDETRAHTETTMYEDMKRLAERGGDLEAVNDTQGATPLHIAAANGYISVAEFLLNHGVRTDVKDKDDWQPAHAAACWGHLEVLELLVKFNADLNAKNKHDEKPADICEDRELKERINLLQQEQEQEHRRLAQAHQKKKVPRTQSTGNSRTHSVRRTSWRDKELTTKRDTVEEARFRIKNDRGIEVDDHKSRPNQNGTTNYNNNKQSENNSKSNSSSPNLNQPPIENRRAPEGKDNTDNNNKQSQLENSKPLQLENNSKPLQLENNKQSPLLENNKLSNNNNHFNKPSTTISLPSSPTTITSSNNSSNNALSTYPHNNNNNNNGQSTTTTTTTTAAADVNNSGKVTVVHVVVTINGNGTLADLKKQRMQIRNNAGDVSAMTSSPTSVNSEESAVGGGAGGEASTDLLRYTGTTEETSTAYSKPNRCCVVM